MIEFMLAVQICASSGECGWARLGYFQSEQVCRETGRSILDGDRNVRSFKCVMQMVEK